MRVPYNTLLAQFRRILLSLGFSEAKAQQCATIFANNSRDGVYSHGLNRFPVFVDYVKEGLVNPAAEPSFENTMVALEQWNGNLGPGMLNATFCMQRAIDLAKDNGIGCVAINNTNHWMRGGTYGWQAAEAGYIGICFTNTMANLPPWGGTEPRLGNNPIVIAVPRPEGHIVLDMAISQYSFGKLQQYKMDGKDLPVPGGYDTEGKLSTDAEAIYATKRALPIGFWKGSGLSLMLDLLATLLSGGNSTAKVMEAGKKETGVSQVFICIKPGKIDSTGLIEQILEYTKSSPTNPGERISYPGENTLRTRRQSDELGVLVDDNIWAKVQAL
ncbi:3-dehydro-L-gulonate 2-dehydrogenase [Mucilaginibacter pallidiroseus]|uniref:3-dehydro-L-gulonate 2-dehydrogenase n=1 Tax=Mucilaginibacter pallidiroseus TaxID=2599295 RepID=A0A563U872_9SPHI|nr:3-dehydro-L-gulonate 2-dehydrogenase [Mucilaginibacter pallidiroseus]TWR27489.1 3-dehydro-L-gulonate 2-dehydrogenase [Mucilaginibacter pallidiroseus]